MPCGFQEKDAEAGEGGGEAETGDDKSKDDKGADVEDGLETVKLEPLEASAEVSARATSAPPSNA